MKYQTKLYLACFSFAVACTALSLGVVYLQVKEDYLQELHTQSVSIAATTAALINAEQLKKINNPSDQNTPEYEQLRAFLRKARNLNQRPDVFVKYVYTLKPSLTDPDQLVIAVSAADTPEETQPIGFPYTSSFDKALKKHINESFSPPMFIKDKWGIWESGFAPIYDAQGKYVGTVGIDIDAAQIQKDLLQLVEIGSIAFIVSLLIAFALAYYFSRRLSYSINALCDLAIQIGKGNLTYKIELDTNDECRDLEQAMYQMCNGLMQKDRLRENFARYVSTSLLEKVLSSDTPPKLEGERRKITVLFSDLRNFTTLSEKMSPEAIFNLLNAYFEEMINVIFSYNGVLDKFLGDGLMVEFGSIIDDPEQERHAVLAAIGMQTKLAELCKKWAEEGRPGIQMGIGIHTGLAIVGNVGSEYRMEFTAIGDTIHVASFLEQATKTLKLPIIISESTAQAIKDEFKLRSAGNLTIPQRSDTIAVYTLDVDYGQS